MTSGRTPAGKRSSSECRRPARRVAARAPPAVHSSSEQRQAIHEHGHFRSCRDRSACQGRSSGSSIVVQPAGRSAICRSIFACISASSRRFRRGHKRHPGRRSALATAHSGFCRCALRPAPARLVLCATFCCTATLLSMRTDAWSAEREVIYRQASRRLQVEARRRCSPTLLAKWNEASYLSGRSPDFALQTSRAAFPGLTAPVAYFTQALHAYSYAVATDLHRLPEHQMEPSIAQPHFNNSASQCLDRIAEWRMAQANESGSRGSGCRRVAWWTR